MKKILCPTDFDPATAKALAYAVDICFRTQAELILMNAYQPPQGGPGVIMVSQPGLGKDTEAKLEALRKHLPRSKPFPVRTIARQGEPVKAIAGIVKAEEPDLILMSTNGTDNLKDELFGTTAVGVINDSEIPVLVIPSDFDFDGKLDKILFTVETLEPSEMVGFKQLTSFAKVFDAQIEVLHLMKKPMTKPEEEAYETKLRDLFNYKKLEFQSKAAEDKDTIQGIVAHFDANPADMVAMITRRRGLLSRIFDPSITTKLASMASVPMLVFHT